MSRTQLAIVSDIISSMKVDISSVKVTDSNKETLVYFFNELFATSSGGPPIGPAGGDLTGTYPNPTLAAVGVAGIYGSTLLVPQITTDSKGRVTGVNELSIAFPVTSVNGRTGAVPLTGTANRISISALNVFDIGTDVVTLSAAQALSNKTGLISQWSNDSLYATPTSATAFTNKTGNISQWTNDTGYFIGTPTLAQILASGRNVDVTGKINTSGGSFAINVNAGTLYSTTLLTGSLDWNAAQLYDSLGISLDWNAKAIYGNWTSNGSLLFSGGGGIDTTSTVGTDTLSIGVTNANVINYGNSTTVHNFLGTAIYELQVNSYVTDKLMTLNYGGAISSGVGVGFEIQENSAITGYFKTNGTRTGFSFLAPANTAATTLIFQASVARDITFQDVGGTVYVSTGTDVSITDGGTGQSTAILGFNALSPVTTRGDIIIRGATNNDRLAIGTTGKYLRSDGTDPSWQTIVASDISSGAALTKADDTNVTLALGGTPSTALLIATSLTLGWTGTLADSRLSTTAVTAGSYGSATQSPTYTVSATGRLTVAANVLITPAASSITGGAALTKTDDTNVTLTFGGAPTTSLLSATSLALGWTGTLGVARGGTNIASYAIGDLLYASGATTISKLVDVAAGSYLRSGGVITAPLWSTLILPNSATANYIPYTTSTNTLGESTNLQFNGSTLTVSSTTGRLSLASTTSTNAVLISFNTNSIGGYIGIESSTPGSFVTTGSLGNALVINMAGAKALQLATSDTVRSTILSSGEFLIGGTAVVSSELMLIRKDQNAGTYSLVSNTTSGTNAFTGTKYSSNSANLWTGALSTAYTTSGVYVAQTAFVTSDTGAGLNIGTINSAQLSFWTNNTQKAIIESGGNFVVGTTASIGTNNIANFRKDINATVYVTATNTTSGLSGVVGFVSTTSATASTEMSMYATSAGYTTSGLYAPNMGVLYTNQTGGMNIGCQSNAAIGFYTNNTLRMTIMAVGNVKIAGTAVRATTEGTNHLDIFDGTAPVGTLANGCSFYSTAGEMRVMDAAGNATLLSPHEKKTNYWIYDSVDTVNRKRLKIDMEKMMKAINEKFGWDFVHEFEVK